MTETISPPVYENVTPSGLKVEYTADPRTYWVNGVVVPSVTQILDVLHKPALPWWGMKVGVAGVIDLWDDGLIQEGVTGAGKGRLSYAYPAEGETFSPLSVDDVVSLLTKESLTVNHVRDKAADRGTSVHQGFEDFCTTGIRPNPLNFPEAERGFVEGLVRFIEEVNPIVLEAEVMVGSAKHGFAGRFDLLARTEEVVVKTGPRTERTIPAGIGVWDLKTSKGFYDSHLLQVCAYAEAAWECGYPESSYQAIVRVSANGRYDVKISPARYWQFLAVKRAWEALQSL
jgi:hypothetical protein